MAVAPPPPDLGYVGIEWVSLVSPRVVEVRFTNGQEATFAVRDLPFATGPLADEVTVIAEGDAIEVIASTGDFEVLADELHALQSGNPMENEPLAKLIGFRLREARTALGYSLRDVEALTGIAAPNLSNLEGGRALPRLDTLQRLASAYHTSLADLIVLTRR